MKNEKMLKAIGNIEDEMILDALDEKKVVKIGGWKKWVAIAAIFILVVVGSIVTIDYLGKSEVPVVVATVALDVNPSMEIEIDKDERVVKVNPLNEDAKIVIDDMDFANVDIDVAVNAIIGSMLKNGYISIDSNSILVSVSSGDEELAKKLQSNISSKINFVLEGSNINASVMTQTYEKNEDINNQANEYDISPAKATLISKIIGVGLKNVHGTTYTYGDLIELNVNELKMILESKEVEVDGVTSIGTASSNAYIAKDEILATVYKHAGVDKSSVVLVECEMDFDGKVILYEVEFETLQKEYEYEVDAKTGLIVDFESELKDDEDKNANDDRVDTDKDTGVNKGDEDNLNFISKEAALEAAYKDAGVLKKDATNIECELEDERKAVYEIEFDTAKGEYSYEIDAVTGKILEKDVEIKTANDNDDVNTLNFISKEAALEAAYKDAGVLKKDATNIECELEDERKAVYEIEFDTAKGEYSYEIDAVTGKILEKEVELKTVDDEEEDDEDDDDEEDDID